MRRSKRYKKSRELVDRVKLYPLEEALAILKSFPPAKFDETVELSIRLGSLAAKEVVRTTVILPHQYGSSKKKILVFVKGEKTKEAKDAGADYVGAEDLSEKILGGWLDFDVAIATPETMSIVAKLARILGPRGLMPNPKNETVTSDITRVIKEIRGGRNEIKSDENGIVRTGVAKVSQPIQQVRENCTAIFEGILKAKQLVKFSTIVVATTMGPGVKVDPSSLKIEQV